jgi:hypothetical protein
MLTIPRFDALPRRGPVRSATTSRSSTPTAAPGNPGGRPHPLEERPLNSQESLMPDNLTFGPLPVTPEPMTGQTKLT